MENKPISELMMNDHNRIETLINRLEKGEETFKNLRWELENHFVIEEKAIFSIFNPDDEEYAQMKGLLKEHQGLLKMLAKINSKFIGTGNTDFNELKKRLMKHKNYEDSFFYPMIEKNLLESQKQKISERISKQISKQEAQK